MTQHTCILIQELNSCICPIFILPPGSVPSRRCVVVQEEAGSKKRMEMGKNQVLTSSFIMESDNWTDQCDENRDLEVGQVRHDLTAVNCSLLSPTYTGSSPRH